MISLAPPARFAARGSPRTFDTPDIPFMYARIATVQLNAFIQHFLLRVGDQVFRHGGRHGVEPMPFTILAMQSSMKARGDPRLGGDFRQFEFGILKFRDRLTEGLSIFDMLDRFRRARPPSARQRRRPRSMRVRRANRPSIDKNPVLPLRPTNSPRARVRCRRITRPYPVTTGPSCRGCGPLDSLGDPWSPP